MAGTQRLQDHLQPFIEVWKVGEEYTPESKPIHVATYLLPLLPLNSYPGMYFGGNTCDVASSGTDLGFRPSQCALLLLNQGGHDLIVSTDVFKDVCTSNADRDRAAEPPVYTWSEWGPSYTRIMSGAWGTSPRCGYRILHGGEIWDFTPNMASEPLDLAASAPQSVCHIHKQECVYSQVGSAAAMPCRRIRADAVMGESKRRDVSYMIETASGPVVRVVERFLPNVGQDIDLNSKPGLDVPCSFCSPCSAQRFDFVPLKCLALFAVSVDNFSCDWSRLQ